MVDLARKSIEDLRKEGVSPTELKRLENILKEGSVGEAFILSSLLRTILDEISPDASQKKLLPDLPGIGRHLPIPGGTQPQSFRYRGVAALSGLRVTRAFESYCVEALGIPASKDSSV